MAYDKVANPWHVTDDTLMAVQEVKELPPVIPPPLKVETPRAATIEFTKPLIVAKDDHPNPPPTVDQLDDNVRISTTTAAGTGDADVVAPPASQGVESGVTEAPKKIKDDDPIMNVQIESAFPGGLEAWRRFLNKNLRYPEDAQNNEKTGTVMVQFVVDEAGNVSNVQAIGGPEGFGLREEAMRVIKKSGLWTPGIQNGRKVKSYKRQPITFQMVNE